MTGTAASTIPRRIRRMVPGTVPAGTNLPGFGRVVRSSLTAYQVEHSGGVRSWVPFVHVHDMPAAEPLVWL